MNFGIDACSDTSLKIDPGFVYGEMMMSGNRKPSPYGCCESHPYCVGGGTWSYQPPKSSIEKKMTVSFQYSLCMILLMRCTVQFSPAQIPPTAGCSSARS